jgi:hypothetical protein
MCREAKHVQSRRGLQRSMNMVVTSRVFGGVQIGGESAVHVRLGMIKVRV